MNCPKCDADISESFENADFSCGILSGGWFCDACDFAIGEHEVDREPMEGDIQISGVLTTDASKLGTPISELSGTPGDPKDQSDPRHAGYEKFKRIAKSWGYD